MDLPSGAAGAPRPRTAAELQAVIHVERQGRPFLVYRDQDAAQRILPLASDRDALTIGRSPDADLSIAWDAEVSALHAQLHQLAGECTVMDDGLSRNGSYVNGERVDGTRRLRDGDTLRIGRTLVVFRRPQDGARLTTVAPEDERAAPDLSPQQRRVLAALCRPFGEDSGLPTPATNQEIAAELFLTEGAVKVHLRALFQKFGVEGLPQNKKRLALVDRALQNGLPGR
jgi:pSer/pThr/pTyr-binding forkhead associated (FHA) protein